MVDCFDMTTTTGTPLSTTNDCSSWKAVRIKPRVVHRANRDVLQRQPFEVVPELGLRVIVRHAKIALMVFDQIA